MGMIGIVANPASGKDVRRLVARASVFDNQEKRAIVQRFLIGAAALEEPVIRYMNDPHGIVEGALRELDYSSTEAVQTEETGTAYDTIVAARRLREAGCQAVLTLGGDGTNRAFALGWQDPVLLPISTGTNNVFPNLGEATIVGAAAGLIAAGRVAAENVSHQQKAIHVSIDGERDDIALIDAVFSSERFVGSRALLDADALKFALLARAEPAAVGMTAIGGLIEPVGANDGHGLLLEMNSAASRRVTAPIAPGYYRSVGISAVRRVAYDEVVTIEGPGVLAFDGERDRRLKPGQQARLHIAQDGPRVVDVAETLRLGALAGAFAV